MARRREYDENAVLTGAMHAFRRQGFGAVSVRDLEAATGLKAGSLYNSFGDKAGLFRAAFVHYNSTVLGQRIARYATPEAGLAGLRIFFLSLLHEQRNEAFGCLITNSAIEFGPDAPPGVGEGLEALLALFRTRLAGAKAAGRLRRGLDEGLGAQRLLALYQGILVLVRAGQDKAALARMIDDDFDVLEENAHGC
jgi:TetR/AcrR family transcriptional repressor of nem operon